MDLSERAGRLFEELQEAICAELEALDGRRRFREDRWDYDSGRGGGRSRVMCDGRVFEKAGVNLARVTGELTPRLAERLEVDPQPFHATGLSLVVHPLSPMVPTVHMNVRFIRLLGPDSGARRRAWFGGGADLTPYYLFEEDARHFHGTWRDTCERHDAEYYPRFKQRCDAYFRNTHRDEARGIGGIFFDYLDRDLERVFAFVEDVGRSFLPAYRPIVERRHALPWWDRERDWQLVRRGRYVEFNLVHDRGTLFGLETGGRTESILMSLPPLVRWRYDHRPEPDSRESELLAVLREPRDWV